MTPQPEHSWVFIGPQDRGQRPLGFGGWSFGPDQWTGQEDANLLSAMAQALAHDLTHFDTAAGYGAGYSERLIGRFMAADAPRRERMFLATKFASDDLTARAMRDAVDASLERLQTDWIDLFYIHWPRTGKDLRPWMEGLETARQQGKIRAIGVSNFSVAQMEQIAEVGRIDAHQLLYNLLWRRNEREIIPYCRKHGIAVVTYSSIAHGILGGRYGRDLNLVDGDQRQTILLFRADVWPHVYAATEAFKRVAEQASRPLIHLAVRWLLRQPGVTSVLVGARNAAQAEANAQALDGVIPDVIFDELTAISDRVARQLPEAPNPYGYNP